MIAWVLGCGSGAPPANHESTQDSVASVDDSAPVDDSTPVIDEDGDGSSPPDDCRDDDPNIHPGADERCVNGVDDDCDGVVDRCAFPLETTDRVLVETGPDHGLYGGAAVDFEGAPGTDTLWICTAGEPSKDEWGTVSALHDAEWPVSSILGSDDAIVEGLSASGDADGDGLADLFIAGGDEDNGNATGWIWSNPVSGIGLDVKDADATIEGLGLGYFVKPTALGDVNADGMDDWFVSGGGAWLIFGPVSGTVEVPDSPQVQPAVENTFVVLGDDLDGDGLNDFVSGGTLTDGTGTGAVHVFLGPFEGPATAESADLRWEGRALGYAVATGDFDGDGSVELLLGGGVAGNSSLFLLESPLPQTTAVDAAASARITGREEDDAIGWALGAADVDGDGAVDMIAGTQTEFNAETHDGEVSIVRGPVAGTISIDDAASLIIEGSYDSRFPGNGLTTGDLDHDGVPEIAAKSLVWNEAHTEVVGSQVHVITPAWLVQL